jgi:hypothetical protein
MEAAKSVFREMQYSRRREVEIVNTLDFALSRLLRKVVRGKSILFPTAGSRTRLLNSITFSQEIALLLWKVKAYSYVRKRPPAFRETRT